VITADNLRAHAARLTSDRSIPLEGIAYGAAQALTQAADYIDTLTPAKEVVVEPVADEPATVHTN
jgi:hypothetical protein